MLAARHRDSAFDDGNVAGRGAFNLCVSRSIGLLPFLFLRASTVGHPHRAHRSPPTPQDCRRFMFVGALAINSWIRQSPLNLKRHVMELWTIPAKKRVSWSSRRWLARIGVRDAGREKMLAAAAR